MTGRMDVNGVRLHVKRSGRGPTVLLLHGFTGSVDTWTPFLEGWRGFDVVAVDLLGHGESDCPPDPQRYRVERCVEDLLAALDELGVRLTAVVGYSMGGRVGLDLALRAPERLWALVLESAAAGIEDERERKARRASDADLADFIEREGVEAFVDWWQTLPLFASQARLPEDVRSALRRQRLANRPRGLANSLRGMGAGEQRPLWERLGEVQAETLLVAGEVDEKYRGLAERMAASMPGSRLKIVPNAGHAAHLEQPRRFAMTVRDFLTEQAQALQQKEERDVSSLAEGPRV